MECFLLQPQAEELYTFKDPDTQIAENLLKVRVYFSSLSTYRIKEEPVYDSVGGQGAGKT